ncbi:MAG: DUF3467 domain-containing protein [Deinococcales bacterium]
MNEFQLEIPPEVARGQYANLAVITHTHDEFIVDFALAYPQQAPVVTARIITSPRHAKALLRSLEENIRRYETHHGVIPEPPRADPEGSN